MKLGIMQPYFFPYMGYWQLIHHVDQFVIYDTIQYTKKGWITRNRFLRNGAPEYFSLALANASSTLDVAERELAPEFDREKLIRSLSAAYQKAPYFNENFPVIADIINHPDQNLYGYIRNSIDRICGILELSTERISSSNVHESGERLKGQERVIAINKKLGASEYVNPIGGTVLYDAKTFKDNGVKLSFLKSRPLEYSCFGQPCHPYMSIIDVLMFNSVPTVRQSLSLYDIIDEEKHDR